MVTLPIVSAIPLADAVLKPLIRLTPAKLTKSKTITPPGARAAVFRKERRLYLLSIGRISPFLAVALAAVNLYYSLSKEFLEAGKRRLMGDTKRQATSGEVV